MKYKFLVFSSEFLEKNTIRALFMLKTQNSKLKTNQRGFTLLMAAIVSSIVLSVGAATFGIALKQVTLSSIGRNSQFAFYAADSGAECALYWDIRFIAFATSSLSDARDSITCDEKSITVPAPAAQTATAATTTLPYYAPNGYCARITIAKSLNDTNGVDTVIHADGYSTKPSNANDPAGTCESAIDADPQALQRSVELHY